MTQLHRQRNNI